MNDIIIKKNTKALQDFIKKANRKLVEVEVMQSILDIKNGKGKVYNSASDFLKSLKTKLS
jgi:hypothetical protein